MSSEMPPDAKLQPLFSADLANAAEEIAKGILETMSENIGSSPAIVIIQPHVAQEFMSTAIASLMTRMIEVTAP